MRTDVVPVVNGAVGGEVAGRSGDVVGGRSVAGGVLSAREIEDHAAAVAEEARRADKSRPGGAGLPAGPDSGSEYCRSVLTGLSGRWPVTPLPDMKPAALTAWEDLLVSLVRAEPGAHAYVWFRRGWVNHGIVLYHSGDVGLVLVDPDQHEEAGYTITAGTRKVSDWLTDRFGTREGSPPVGEVLSLDTQGQVVPALAELSASERAAALELFQLALEKPPGHAAPPAPSDLRPAASVPGAHGFAAAPPSAGEGDAETVAAAPIHQVVNRPDEGPRHPAPPAPSPGALTPEQGDSSARPESVTSRPVSSAEEAARLAGLSPDERMSELQAMSADDREALGSDREFISELKKLSREDFASAVAQLMIRVPSGVEQPATARQQLHAILTRMLSHNPDVAEKLITAGGRVFIIPRTVSLTSLEPWRQVVGHDRTRGITNRDTAFAAVPEENLVGEISTVHDPYPTGFSVVTHEIAHLIHLHGLGVEDRKLISQRYKSKLEFAKSGFNVQWPDGPLTTRQGETAYNYSAKNETEYFAQLTNAYLGTNAGIDLTTQWPRNNGTDWVVRHENVAIVRLLEKIYGPVVEGLRANPLWQTQAENRMYRAFREFNGEPGGDVVEPARDAGADPWAIFGEFNPKAFTFIFGGGSRSPEQVARWVARNTDHRLGDSVTLVPLNAEEPGEDWDSWEDEVGFGDFAEALATHLGGLVAVADPVGQTKTTYRPQFWHLSADQREALASDRDFVHQMRVSLRAAEFAAAVADLMIRMPPGVEQTMTAQQRLRSIIMTMLSNDPEIAEKVINAGGRVSIIPRAESLTSLGPWRAFAGKELAGGRPADRERSIRTGALAAVSEEDLLGDRSSLGVSSPAGHSDAVHVFAQLLYAYGLNVKAKSKILASYNKKRQQSDAIWPGGSSRLPDGSDRPADPGEYFAALTNFYLEAHAAHSHYTDKGSLTGWSAVQRHDEDMHGLLLAIYGRNAKIAEVDPPGQEDDPVEEKAESSAGAVSAESGSAAGTAAVPREPERNEEQGTLPRLSAAPAPAPAPTGDGVAASAADAQAAVETSVAATDTPAAPRPLPPWYAANGGLGDGHVSSVTDVVARSVPGGKVAEPVDDWINSVTAGLDPSVAGSVRTEILALLTDSDPKTWEKLLRHGRLIVVRGVRVKLTFSAEELDYEPPADAPVDPGYQEYFSKYGDTSFSEGDSRHVRSARSGRLEPIFFLAVQGGTQAALSHAGPTGKITVERGYSSGHSIAMEVQSGNRVIANATHSYSARIRIRATVNREFRPSVALPGKARLAYPQAYSSAAETPAMTETVEDGGHPVVRVADPEVLHGLDYAVNAALPEELLVGLAETLENEFGLSAEDADVIVQDAAEEYFNEKTIKDRSQWWLTDSWVSGVLAKKVQWVFGKKVMGELAKRVPRLSEFQGHLEISGQPHTVRYVTTTDDPVLLRNDIADTALIRDGETHDSGASVTPGVALGIELGEHLTTPTVDIPKVGSSRGHGYTVGREGQAKIAVMRKDRLVRYRTEYRFTVAIKSNLGDAAFTVPVVGELGIGRGHAKEFERRALGGVLTGSGLVTAEEFEAPVARSAVAPELPAGPRTWFVSRLMSGFAGSTAPPEPFGEDGVRDVEDLHGLADQRPVEIAIPGELYDTLMPELSSETWRGLFGHDNVTWVLMDADRSTLVSRAEEPGTAPWRYVLDDQARVSGALFMHEQPGGAREPRGWVPNPAATSPLAVVETHAWHEPLERPLRAAGMGSIARFLKDGGIPQVQLTEALRLRLGNSAEPAAKSADPVIQAVRMMMATRIPVIAADGRRLGGGQDGAHEPEKRFVVDEYGRVRAGLRPWRHVVHPREPLALAARKGLGKGIVRETPGLEEIYPQVTKALAHQMRSAGVKLSADERQHLARVLATKFGVPGLRGEYPGLIDVGVSHQAEADGYIFTASLDGELRALRRDPVAESDVTLDSQRKGVASLDVEEEKGLSVSGGFNIRFRLKLKNLFSIDLDVLSLFAKRGWTHKIIDSTGVKEYRRDKTSGDVTRFEYEAVYTLAVTARRPSEGVVSAQVREFSGDRYWTAVTVSDEYLPDKPVPADEVATFGEATVVRGPLDEDGIKRLAGSPGSQPGTEFDLNKQGMSGIRVTLSGLAEISTNLAQLVAAHNKTSWVGTKADPFQQVLAKIVPSGRRYGVAQRILRSGTQTFMEAGAPAMLRKRGLAIPLPPTKDGWNQEVRIRLRTFNVRYEKTVHGATLEQYTETDPRFAEEDGAENSLEGGGGPGGVIRLGIPKAEQAEGGRTTSQKTSNQLSAGVSGSGEMSRGAHQGDQGGALDLNLGTYSGDSEQFRAEPVYTMEYRRWRGGRRRGWRRAAHWGSAPRASYRAVRHAKISGGSEFLVPHVRAVDHGLSVRSDVPVKPDERRHVHPDLAMAAAYVEKVNAEDLVDVIENLLGGDLEPEMLRAVEAGFSEDAVRAQFPTERRAAIHQIFKSPATFWRKRSLWEYLKIPAQLEGTLHTGIRVTFEEESLTYERPRPDVRVTTGGQGFVQRGKGRSRGRAYQGGVFVHGRWATAPKGFRPAGGGTIEYARRRKTTVGATRVTRDIRRATAKDTSQEFAHTGTFRVEVFHHYSSNELFRRAGQLIGLAPRLVEVFTHGESRRLWQRVFPPTRPSAATAEIPGRAAVLVPTHLTTTAPSAAPSVPAGPVRTAITRTPAPPVSPLAEALAEHVQALSMPGADQLPLWAPAAAIPGRRIDQDALAGGIPPIVDEFEPTRQDGLTADIALSEENLKANIAPLLRAAFRSPLLNREHLTVQLVPTRGRWVHRGGYTALNFPEEAEEPERETEMSGGLTRGLEFDLGHRIGRPIQEGAEQSLLDPGASRDRGRENVRVQKNSTGDYVESNRQRDGDFDYYVFDAEYHITGPHRHHVVVTVPDGFFGMLPATVVRRLIDARALDVEPPPLDDDLLPAEWAQNGTLPPEATAHILDQAGGASALRDRTLRLWSKAEHLTSATTAARRLTTQTGVPVELLIHEDDGSISRHPVMRIAESPGGYATKTPYVPQQDLRTYEQPPPGFTPVFTQSVFHHGSRAETKSDYGDQILGLWEVAAGEGALTRDGEAFGPQVRSLRDAFTEIGYGNLSGRGRQELRDAAVRMRERLPGLFTRIAENSERIDVVNSGKGRAVESGNAFTAALAARDPALKPLLGSARTDPDLLHFHMAAGGAEYRSYLAGDERLAAKLQEIEQQPAMQEAARSVLLKIFTPAFVDRIFAGEFAPIGARIGTGVDAAHAVYRLRSFAPLMSHEGTWDLERYVTADDASWLAYLSDAKTFYRKGPGFEDSDITYTMANVLLDDFFANIEAKRAGTSDLGAALRFAHAEAIIPFAVLLGLPGSEKTATLASPDTHADNPWRGESVSPMAANIQWDVFQNGDTYLVRMLHNEKETPFGRGAQPVSENSMFYDLDELLRSYGRTTVRARGAEAGTTVPRWSPPRLGGEATRRAYPWLPKINPARGGDSLTNCLLTGIGVDLTFEEALLHLGEDPGTLPYYQVPPDAASPYEHLASYGKGDPLDVPGYKAIYDAMHAAGRGARGMVLVGVHDTDVDHVFNVVHDDNGVVFLDGQKGREAYLPGGFRSLRFLPTSEGFPREAVEVAPVPWRHGRFLGAEPGRIVTLSEIAGSQPEAEAEPVTDPFAGPGRRLGGRADVAGSGSEIRAQAAEERARREPPAVTSPDAKAADESETSERSASAEAQAASGPAVEVSRSLARPSNTANAVSAPRARRLGAWTAVDRARATLDSLAEERRAQVMKEASALFGDLSGRVPSVIDSGGRVSPVDRARLLVAAELARASRAAGEGLARRLAHELEEPLVPRVPIDSARVDVARTTLERLRNDSEERYAQILDEARLIVRQLTGVAPSPAGVRGRARRLTAVWLLTAAEIPWAGHRAAQDLAADLIGLPRLPESGVEAGFVNGLANAARHDPARARTTLGLLSPTRLEGLLNPTDGIIREAITRPRTGQPRSRAPREWRLLVAAEIARSGEQAGEDLARNLVADNPPRPADATTTTTPAATAQPRMPIEDVLKQTRAVDVDGRPVAVLLPGALEEAGLESLGARMRGLAAVLPEGGVFVFGTVRDGLVMAGEHEVTVEATAAAITQSAPGLSPYLLIDGGAGVAQPLSRVLDGPVVATPYRVEFDPVTGDVTSVRSGDTPSGSSPRDEWFRVFSLLGAVEGEPIVPALFGRGRRDGLVSDTEPSPEPDPGSSFPSAGEQPLELPGLPEPSAPPKAPAPPEEVATPIDADPMIRSIGVPRAGLPQMPALLRRIRQALDEAGVNYTENELALLTHRLLANYRYLGMNDAAGETGDSGLQVPIGDGELLVTLDATDPHAVRNPAGSTLTPSALPSAEGEHHAVGTTNSVFATGAHAQSQSGQTGATRGALSLTFGVPVAPGVIMRFGGSLSGTANQSNRSDTHIADAEGGHVEDNRTEHKLIAYTAKWSFKVRTDPERSWNRTPVHRLDEPTGERLLLWIPDHYLEKAPSDQVTATGETVKTTKLPSYFFASGLTNLPRLFDEIAVSLRESGLKLPMGSSIRQELLQKLWNLDMHLDAAVNTARGYRFRLHNKYGRPVATVSVKSERLTGAPRVGATSDKSHIENVRTAIDGWSGGHAITNSSGLTFPSVEVDLGAPVSGLEKAGLGISTYLSIRSSSNTDGISAGRTGLHVLVPRDTSYTNAYDMSFTHRATVGVRGKRAPRTTRPVPGRALVRVPEAAAYEHGLPVDREALKNPPAHGGTRPYEADAIRGTGRRDDDPETKPVPRYVAEGKGVGMGLVMVADATVERIRGELIAELRKTGFLSAREDDPFAGYEWYGHGNKLDSLVDSEELFDKMVSSRGLDSHYDQIHQDGMTFTLRKRRGGMGVDWDVDSAKVTIKARKNPAHPPEFKRSTDEFHTVNLAMGMDSAGMSVSHSRKIALGLKFKGLFQALRAAMMGVEFQRSVGAADAVGFLNNRPELLEYPGKVDEFALTSDYEITVEYQHSGVQGRVRKSVRDPDPITVENQTALAYLLPLGTEDGPILQGPTPAEVLEQGVVYFVDTTGVRGAVTALGRMTDPAGTASAARDT
ncbi:histidine-type phosphatase, partial [Actinoallomurus sp. NPDC052308]|uniref:histidine-type phosphatase n=1 Tax=Actinoallomurus sp. NPDC052308 TaxID=3155530 RepID=UPI003428CC52